MRSSGLTQTNPVSILCFSVLTLIILNCVPALAHATNDKSVEAAFDYRHTVVSAGKLKAIQSQALVSAPGMKSWQIDLNPRLKTVLKSGAMRIPLPEGGSLAVTISTSRTLANGDLQIIGEFAEGGEPVQPFMGRLL